MKQINIPLLLAIVCFLMPLSAQTYSVQVYDGANHAWRGWSLRYNIAELCEKFPGLLCPAGEGYAFIDEPGYQYFTEMQSEDTYRSPKELEANGCYGYVPPTISVSESGCLQQEGTENGLGKGCYLLWYAYHCEEKAHPFDTDCGCYTAKRHFYLQLNDDSWSIAFDAAQEALTGDYAVHVCKVNPEYLGMNFSFDSGIHPSALMAAADTFPRELYVARKGEALEIEYKEFGTYAIFSSMGYYLLISVNKDAVPTSENKDVPTPRGASQSQQDANTNNEQTAQETADINPLIEAVKAGDAKLVADLISNGADVNTHDGEGHTLLHFAAWAGYTDIARQLIGKGAELNARDGQGYAPLHWGTFKGQTDVVRLLLDKGAAPNTVNHYGDTALHIAVEQNEVGIARLLLDKGAELSTVNASGNTPLQIAAQENLVELARVLIEKDADVNSVDASGLTLLHHAAVKGRSDLVCLLLEEGADVNVRDEEGQSPLHKAALGWGDHSDIVRMLLRQGADIHAKDNKGHTPLDIAQAEGNAACAKLLREASEKKE